MQDRELYARILGITDPWRVERVDLRLEIGEVHIILDHAPDLQWPCPECGELCTLHDHQPERRWRHLDTCQYKTILHAAPPRSNCPEHGPRVVKLPWAEPGSRFTALFEGLAISWLRAASQKEVAHLLGMTWDEIHHVMARAVRRGMARRVDEPAANLGVDEKSFKKRHKYLTVVNDLDGSRVLYVAPGRSKASLDGFWPTLTKEQREAIRSVSIDMWDPYIASIKKHVEDAQEKIVFDKFHVAAHLGKAVDMVRRRENRELLRHDDRRLVKTTWSWLRNGASLSDDQWRALRDADLKTARAWALKETGMDLYLYRREHAARAFFDRWYAWAIRSRLKPMVEVAMMLKKRIKNILTYVKLRTTNAKSEALNSKIQWVKYMARGYRNMTNFITAIYFHCGGLSMNPLPT
jgi:transposase